jgi:hypothetical protein
MEHNGRHLPHNGRIADYALRSDDEFALAEWHGRASYGAVLFAAVAVLG